MIQENQVFCVDIKPISFNPEKSSPLIISYSKVLDFTKHAVPVGESYIIKYDIDIMNSIYPDIIAHHGLNKFNINRTTLKNDVRNALSHILNENIIVSLYTEEYFLKMMNEINCNAIGTCKFIDLPYVLRKSSKIPTSKWSYQGYDIPPKTDPFFIETCFYGLVPKSEWQCLSENSFNHHAQMGAMIMNTLLKSHSIDDFVKKTQLREDQ